MAKATKKAEEVTEVTLTMSREEAEALAWLLGGVAGSDDSPRALTGQVWAALGKHVTYGDLTKKWRRPPINIVPKPVTLSVKQPKCSDTSCTSSYCNPTAEYVNYSNV